MKKKIILVLLCVMMISGCSFFVRTRYIVYESDKRVWFINKGDRIIRQNVQPQEVIMDYDGMVLSNAEYRRLKKIEEEYVLDI